MKSSTFKVEMPHVIEVRQCLRANTFTIDVYQPGQMGSQKLKGFKMYLEGY